MTDAQAAQDLYGIARGYDKEYVEWLCGCDSATKIAVAKIARALAARERAVLGDAIVLLKRRAEHYTGTRDISTVTRDIQFNEVMGCIETLEHRQQAEAGG